VETPNVEDTGATSDNNTEKSPDDKSPEKPTDVISRIIAIAAFEISLITFITQFVAHDKLLYSLSDLNLLKSNTDFLYSVSLSIFNEGNRPAALISEVAEFKQFILKKQKDR
jgi:hypothetical protein